MTTAADLLHHAKELRAAADRAEERARAAAARGDGSEAQLWQRQAGIGRRKAADLERRARSL